MDDKVDTYGMNDLMRQHRCFRKYLPKPTETKPIPNFPHTIDTNATIINTESGRVQIGCLNEKYRVVTLRKDKKSTTCRVHILLAKAFIPNPDNLPYVNHIDGYGLNNELDNLRWSSTYNKLDNSRYKCSPRYKTVPPPKYVLPPFIDIDDKWVMGDLQ